ncbi:MAG: hypothetical protein LQ351_006778, partial [Letrouitia transgressa]
MSVLSSRAPTLKLSHLFPSSVKSADSIARQLDPVSNNHYRLAKPLFQRSFTSLGRQPYLFSPRTFSTSQPQYKLRTVQQVKSRGMTGPFNLRAAVLFLTAAGLLTVYFRHEKDRLERKKIADMSKGIGRPLIGGPFKLKDTDGAEWTEEKLKGGFTLVYFGFTHCPDICPEELDKMAHVITRINKTPANFTAPSPSTITEPQNRPNVLPLFITCDPARDTPDVLRAYLAEFHPSLVGLTGDYEQIKEMCKQYRVYFSTPEGVKPGMDYL